MIGKREEDWETGEGGSVPGDGAGSVLRRTCGETGTRGNTGCGRCGRECYGLTELKELRERNEKERQDGPM